MAATPKKKKAVSTKKTAKKKKKASRRRFSPQLRERAEKIQELLDEHFPDVRCALHYRTPFELICAVILSAQCTDEMVNKVTPALFDRYPDAPALAKARQESVEKLVKSTGFFRNKAKNIIGCARRLTEEYGGEVPASMEDLLTLPGVARKTANVVLGECFGIADGIVVDTHVGRIAGLLGLTREKDPKKIEQDLMALIPRDNWIMFAHQLIHHGRKTCKARKPLCGECFLRDLCPSATS